MAAVEGLEMSEGLKGCTLDEAIKKRKSIRKYLPTPVPPTLMSEVLELAQLAPSHSNIQPWRLFLATGTVRDRVSRELVAAATDAVKEGTLESRMTVLPSEFMHHRAEMGAIVYGAMGIGRDDTAARHQAVLRNFDFFGAPMVGVVCVHRELGPAGALAVGAWLQTLMLALTARGLGSTAQISLTAFSDILRRAMKIPDELTIICGLSIGYPDWEFPANQVKVPRAPLDNNVTYVDE